MIKMRAITIRMKIVVLTYNWLESQISMNSLNLELHSPITSFFERLVRPNILRLKNSKK